MIDNVRTRSVAAGVAKPLTTTGDIAAHHTSRIMDSTISTCMLDKTSFLIFVSVRTNKKLHMLFLKSTVIFLTIVHKWAGITSSITENLKPPSQVLS